MRKIKQKLRMLKQKIFINYYSIDIIFNAHQLFPDACKLDNLVNKISKVTQVLYKYNYIINIFLLPKFLTPPANIIAAKY